MVTHDIAPVSGTIPVSAIPLEEYLKIFLCVLETLFLVTGRTLVLVRE
jgi:hypothetical protein